MRTSKTAIATWTAAGLLAASLGAAHVANAQSPADFFVEEARRVQRQTVRESTPPPPTRQAPLIASSEFNRIVCTRTCDGARMVMAIRSSDRDNDRYEQMCRAAGSSNATAFSIEKLAPIKASDLVATGPVMDGRATMASSSACAGKPGNLSVPIFSDATLRRGDVVALNGGLHVFIGSGAPPFKIKDFRLMNEKNMAKGLRGMTVAGTTVH